MCLQPPYYNILIKISDIVMQILFQQSLRVKEKFFISCLLQPVIILQQVFMYDISIYFVVILTSYIGFWQKWIRTERFCQSYFTNKQQFQNKYHLKCFMFECSVQFYYCCLSITQDSSHHCDIVLKQRIMSNLSMEKISIINFFRKISKINMYSRIQCIFLLICLIYCINQIFNFLYILYIREIE